MSEPREPDRVKLIASLFSAKEELILEAAQDLEGTFGSSDWMSPPLFFNRTRYYEKEMGWPLHRRFVSFMNLILPDDIARIKRTTNDLENRFRRNGKRRVNIDPGYICLERLVLATGKNYIHRIYLSQGIYADLTLIFRRGSFAPLEWTYKDYADPTVIDYFNALRERYLEALRSM